MSRTVLFGGRIFDGTGSPIADGDVAIEDGRIARWALGLDGDSGVDVTGMHASSRSVRLSRARDQLGHRPAAASSAALLLPVLRGCPQPCGYAGLRHHHGARRGRRGPGDPAGGRRRAHRRAADAHRGHHAEPDGGPRGRLAAVRGCGRISGQPYPAGLRASSTGRRRCGSSVSEIVRAGANVIKVCTSGGVLSPRDDPRHAHFRPDELAALMAEASAAGLPVMAHAQATDGIKAAVRAGVRSIEHGIYLDDEAIDDDA